MKVLLFNGSPHEKGCTYTALSEVANTIAAEGIETEIVWLGTEPIHSCTACRSCATAKKCVFDDIVNEAAARCAEADGFIFGTPVHYAAATGMLTTFMDRLFYTIGKTLALKPAAGVVSCRRSGSTATFDQLNKYFTICQMPVVPSQYWNAVHGHAPEDVRQDLEGMQTMRTLGRNMAWMLKCIAVGTEAGVPRPVQEERVNTNFIR